MDGPTGHAFFPFVCLSVCPSGVPSKDEVRRALFATLAANGMRDGAHVRLTLSRGLKTTSSMNPGACMKTCMPPNRRSSVSPSLPPLRTVFNAYGCTLIIVPERKPVGGVATYVRWTQSCFFG